MVDVPLMEAMLAALPEEAGLLLVGDADQLPSVGPGQVLADLIASERLAVIRLDQVFRQAAQSQIVRNAHHINHGAMPELARDEGQLSDFYAIKARGPEDGARLVLELVSERIPARFGVDPLTDIQVLCPTNRGELGARHLNQALQASAEPGRRRPDRALRRDLRARRQGDAARERLRARGLQRRPRPDHRHRSRQERDAGRDRCAAR